MIKKRFMGAEARRTEDLVAHALEYRQLDQLWAYRLRLLTSAILIVVSAGLILFPGNVRYVGIFLLLVAIVNSLWSLRMLRLIQARFLASRLLSDALLSGDDAGVETAWLTLLYLADPSVREDDHHFPALHKMSPFRHLPRRMRYARGH